MVNASLNWASIVGIVLAVGGALLYFMRSFKPALARDYDVFFAAVGLLCGGILFFQGWRLDPILQFGQFLLAGTTVFFAYESVRLRGVTTEQARRSSFFDEEDEPAPRGRMGGRPGWESDTERFDEPQPLRRRIRSLQDESEEDDFYRPRRTAARPAIPERAASRRPRESDDWDTPPPAGRTDEGFGSRGAARGPAATPPLSASGAAATAAATSFGSRRRDRDAGAETRRGSRPVPSSEDLPRSSRRPAASGSAAPGAPSGADASAAAGVPQGSPIRSRSGRASSQSGAEASGVSDADFTPLRSKPRPSSPGRDNSSRFDD